MKKEYIRPTIEVIGLPPCISVLAYFSADADVIEFIEMQEETLTPNNGLVTY